MSRRLETASFALFFALAGCAGTQAAAPSPATPSEPSAASQVETGGALYAANCAGCHGDQGQGGRAPAVVGAGALSLDPLSPESARQVQFATAGDVLAWVSEHMPPGGQDRLTADEYAAIIAFALSANGVDLAGQTVSAENASTWVLH